MMKLIAVKALPIVPWFDDFNKFKELGVFNYHGDVFVVAEYYGDKHWENEVEPSEIINHNTPKKMKLTLPIIIQKGENFVVSGEYEKDGDYLIYIGDFPVLLSVVSGKINRDLSIPFAGEYTLTSVDVNIDPYKITVSL